MAYRNQIVGLIRFSLVTTGDFYPGFETVDALRAFLFDEARLARRFTLFEALTLPALAGQTDQDFTLILLTAADLPEPWMTRLRDLVAPYPWARIDPQPPAPHYATIRAAFRRVPAEGYSHRTSFRLDDDDAFDLGHIARLRRLAERLGQVRDSEAPFALGFNRGFYLQLRDGERNDVFDARERTPLSVGAALVAPADHPENVYNRNHRALPQWYDCWSDAESFVYLRSLHQDNKSNPHFSGNQRELDANETNRILRENFGLKPGELRALRA